MREVKARAFQISATKNGVVRIYLAIDKQDGKVDFVQHGGDTVTTVPEGSSLDGVAPFISFIEHMAPACLEALRLQIVRWQDSRHAEEQHQMTPEEVLRKHAVWFACLDSLKEVGSLDLPDTIRGPVMVAILPRSE